MRRIIKDSLTYPFSDWKKFLILLVLFWGSFLLIPLIIGFGYLWKIIQHSLNGYEGFPEFGDFGQLFVKGIKLLVVSVIYGIPSFIISSFFLSQITTSSLYNGVTIISGHPVNIVIKMVVGFLINFVIIIAVANMVNEDRFMSAFDFKRIYNLIRKIGSKKYILSIIVFSLIMYLLSLPSVLISPTSHGIFNYIIQIIVAILTVMVIYSKVDLKD